MTGLVFLDADNTLWDTDSVYRAAQEWILDQVEDRVSARTDAEDRLAFVRAVDQELAHNHHAGLRYPSRLLARALALVLKGETVVQAVKRVWSDGHAGLAEADAAALEAEFGRRLGALPALRHGVSEAIERLRASDVATVVLTEGSRPRILRTLASHQLDDRISKVIEARKDARLFRLASRLTGASDAFMVGDQLDRDIAPAKAAGLTTIYFPGGFTPRWTPEVDRVGPSHTVASLTEAADIILARATPALRRRGDGPALIDGGKAVQFG